MLPPQVQAQLDRASARVRSKRTASRTFSTSICSPEWNRFIMEWAPISARFVEEALAGFQKQPLREIKAISAADHAAGANASFQPSTGQVCLSPSYVEGKPGTTLEKLTHEFVHAALNDFPEGEEFFEEGAADHSTWVLAHAPIWGAHREDMIEAARFNIAMRQERAFRTQSEYDRKRWAGGLCSSLLYGPWIVARLRNKKLAGDLTW